MTTLHHRDIHVKTCGYAKYRININSCPSTPLLPSQFLDESSTGTATFASSSTGTTPSNDEERPKTPIISEFISVRIATPISSSK